MLDNFFSYIDSLGELSDEDLYADIDETMETRKMERAPDQKERGRPRNNE